jgi:Lrp/AsnC family transcriptional regulator for asnA, asnC and gidA
MDGKDYKIIADLQKGARTPLRKISKRIGICESAVRKRVKRLERAGVIERYTVVVDPSKLGYNAMAVIDLDVVPEKYREVIGKLTKLGEFPHNPERGGARSQIFLHATAVARHSLERESKNG